MSKGFTIALFIGLVATTNSFQIPADDYHGSRIIRSVSVAEEDNYRCTSQETYEDIFPGDCKKYYHCSEGQATVKTCSFLHRFDPVKLSCKLFLSFWKPCQTETVSTTVSPVPTNPTSYTQEPTGSTGRTSGTSTGPHTAGTGTGGNTVTPSPTQATSGVSQICGMVSVVLMLTSAVLLTFRY